MIGKKYTRILRQVIAAVFIVAQTNIFSVLSFFAILAPLPVQASFPNTVGYQGRLKNSAGTAQTGSFTFIFRFYASTTGGSALWTETQTVTVDSGSFAVLLGSSTAFPASLDFNAPLFLSTEVNGDGEMSPRITINTVPYAFRAGGIDSQAFAPSAATGGRMFYDTGTGVLKYFDGIANSWRALDASSTLQTVTTLGNTTTRDIQFAGGTSTAAFTIQSSLTVTGQTSSTSLLFVNATGTNTTSTNLFGSVLGFTTGNGTNLTTTNATTTNIAVTGGASANFNPLVDALLSLGSPALRWNGNF
ncbi:MAG: hypothetical protein AAB386_04895, partial [Patescibacteria group bacterium]